MQGQLLWKKIKQKTSRKVLLLHQDNLYFFSFLLLASKSSLPWFGVCCDIISGAFLKKGKKITTHLWALWGTIPVLEDTELLPAPGGEGLPLLSQSWVEARRPMRTLPQLCSSETSQCRAGDVRQPKANLEHSIRSGRWCSTFLHCFHHVTPSQKSLV